MLNEQDDSKARARVAKTTKKLSWILEEDIMKWKYFELRSDQGLAHANCRDAFHTFSKNSKEFRKALKILNALNVFVIAKTTYLNDLSKSVKYYCEYNIRHRALATKKLNRLCLAASKKASKPDTLYRLIEFCSKRSAERKIIQQKWDDLHLGSLKKAAKMARKDIRDGTRRVIFYAPNEAKYRKIISRELFLTAGNYLSNHAVDVDIADNIDRILRKKYQAYK